MSPRARSVESKRKRMPRKRKVKPRNIRPVPILVLSETMLLCINNNIIQLSLLTTLGPWRLSAAAGLWLGSSTRYTKLKLKK